MKFFKRCFSVAIVLFLLNSCAGDSREELEIRPDTTEVITFDNQVRQIISQDCLNCHTNPPRNGAPFSLVTFEEVRDRAQSISNAINGRSILMPPGVNLPQSRIDVIDTWIEEGLKEN